MKENVDFLTRTQQLKVDLYIEYLSKTAETSRKVVLKLKSVKINWIMYLKDNKSRSALISIKRVWK